jgi:hypothetical protein
MPVEQEVLDYQYDDSHVTVQPCKNNTLLATNLTWQSDRQYYEGDVVYRNGRMYVAKNNNIDKRPDITTNWMLAFAEPFKETGFVLSNNASDANNDIDISAGRCYDSTGLIPIVGTAMTKRLDAAIALGSGTGGLFSGSKATSTLYYVFVIVRDNDGTVNYGFSTSLTATDRPAGWTVYRLLHIIATDALGNIVTIPGIINTTWDSRYLLSTPTTYTPIFTGFGTVSAVTMYYWRDGPFLFLWGKFTVGTTTATEARMSFPLNFTSSSTMIPSLMYVGKVVTTMTGAHTLYCLAESATPYLTFGYQGAGYAGLVKRYGSSIFGNGIVCSLMAKIPLPVGDF